MVLFEEGCLWRNLAIEALSKRKLRWNVVCEATTLVAMATAVQVGIGIGPMLAATIPPGCRAFGSADNHPESLHVDIGLYARTSAPEPARYLANFITRMPSRL